MQPITLVCGADNKFSMPLAVTMFSAIVNLRAGVAPTIYIIDGGINERNKKKIAAVLKRSKRKFRLNWLRFDVDKLGSLTETDAISKAAYLRVLIPELLPNNFTKAIYLDCDMIVESDLMGLWEQDIAEVAAMGVQDYCSPYISTTTAIPDFADLGLPEKTPYCNSGLLVMNLEYWRRNDLKASVFGYLKKNNRALDQDGINVAIGGKWKLLDARWNVTLSSLSTFGHMLGLGSEEVIRYREQIVQNPYIIHFTSRFKPWHSGRGSKEALTSFYFDQPFIARFFYYLEATKWYHPVYFLWWKNYRRAVLLLEYKLPRRLAIFKSKFEKTGVPV